MRTIKELRATAAGADDFEASDLAIFADFNGDADDPVEVQLVSQCATSARGFQPPQIEQVTCYGATAYVASRGYSEGYSYRIYATAQAAYDSLNLDDEPWISYGVAPIPGLLLKDAITLWNRESRSVRASEAKAVCNALAMLVEMMAGRESASYARAAAWLG